MYLESGAKPAVQAFDGGRAYTTGYHMPDAQPGDMMVLPNPLKI